MNNRFTALLYLMRWVNIAFLLFTQFIIYFKFADPFVEGFTLVVYLLLCSGILSLAASGNLINTLLDEKTDLINKPKRLDALSMLGKRPTRFLYYLLSVLGILCGLAASLLSQNKWYFVIFIMVWFLLWAYSYAIKRFFLVGNILVSALVALSIYIPFQWAVAHYPLQILEEVNLFIFTYVFFAFMVNLIREIVKDAEDVSGDFAVGYQSLPILLGKQRTNLILQLLILICISSLIGLYFQFFKGQLFAAVYILLILVGWGVFVFTQTNNAKHKSTYKKISMLIKLWMCLGIGGLLLY